MKKILILTLLFFASCSLDKVIQHHGVHNLDKKQAKLKVNYTNKNDSGKRIVISFDTKKQVDNHIK